MNEVKGEFLTTHELAALCRTSPETVRYWRHVGKGPRSFKLGRRVLYDRKDIDAWIKEARNHDKAA
ncbi:MAG: helix-turn-helix domain-containing protein [Propionibacteriaceae bacterium]|nr:helix-turn-helix domain-containing protein [Propionibacteriaceae bacterium]